MSTRLGTSQSSVTFAGTGPFPVFDTVQGEGVFAGKLSTFVRFYGCNQSCAWCDTKPSWSPGPGGGIEVEFDYLYEKFTWEGGSHAIPINGKNLVITGGNPLLPEHQRAIAFIVGKCQWESVTIETNAYGLETMLTVQLEHALIEVASRGTLVLSLSPKAGEYSETVFRHFVDFGRMLRGIRGYSCVVQVKPVVETVEQAQVFLAALVRALGDTGGGRFGEVLVVQPEWSATKSLVQKLLENPPIRAIMGRFLDARILPQIHKSLKIL